MSNRVIMALDKIGATIETDAKDVGATLAKVGVKIEGAAKGLPALAELLANTDKALSLLSGDITDPAQLVLDWQGQLAVFKAEWNDVKATAKDMLGITI